MRKEAEQVLVTLRGQSHGYDVEAEIAALDHELGETANQPQASWSEVREGGAQIGKAAVRNREGGQRIGLGDEVKEVRRW